MLNALTYFPKYIQQDYERSKRKGNVIFNSKDKTYRMNSSELKTLFKSNHEEAETKIVCYCSSFNKLCIVTDIDLILFNIDDLRIYSSTTRARLVHANRLKMLLLVLEKFMKTLAVPLACCGHSFMQSPVVIRLVISLMFQSEYCFNEHHQVF